MMVKIEEDGKNKKHYKGKEEKKRKMNKDNKLRTKCQFIFY